MTHDFNNPHESGRSMPGSSLKVIVATAAVALVAVLLHVSIEGQTLETQDMRTWQGAQPVPGSVNTLAASEGCPIESPDGHYLFMASKREGRAYDKTSGRQLAERIKSRGRAARTKKS